MAKAKKLPSGNWRVRASKNGVTKSFTNEDRKMAEAMAARWAAELDVSSPDKMTVSEAYERYIKSKKAVLSPNTLHAYKTMADNYFLSLKNIRIDKLNDEQIQIAVNELSAQKSSKTVRNTYGLLTAVLGMYRPAYRPKITLPQKQKTEIHIPTRQDIKTLLEYTKDKNIYVPIILAAFCGMREAEICALTSKDIKSGKIHVNKTMVYVDGNGWQLKPPKSFAGDRYIEMPPAVEVAITGKNGNVVNYTPDGLRMTFKKTLKAAGVNNMRFHDLRHYYVSELFDMGLPEKYIIAQVGHSSASITKAVYDHLSKEKQSQYSNAIAEHFNFFD